MEATIRRTLPLILLAGTSLVLAVLPLLGVPQTWLLYLFHFFVFLAAANMWNLLAGYSGLLALCPAAFIGLAAYTMTLLSWVGVPFYVGILAGGLASALFATLISIAVFRMSGIYFAIGTLVLPDILRLVFLRWRPVGGEFHGGGAGYIVKGGASSLTRTDTYWLALLVCLISVAVLGIILRSKFGLGLAAIRDNPSSAASAGIDVFRLKLASFIIAAFVMGASGAVYSVYKGSIEPISGFGIDWLMIVLLSTVIGGIGIEIGPLVGAALFVVLRFQLARYGSASLLIQGIILVTIMLVAPQGIVGLVRDLHRAGKFRALSRLAPWA
jgi:branched-chain amino acid transport system permease protein